MQPYKLFFELEIWSTNDGAGGSDNGSYEPYGHIYLEIGSLNVNQDIDMWNIAKTEFLYVTNGESHFINRTLSFMEFDNFDQIGNITAHGEVWDHDFSKEDDNIGRPEGDLFQAKDLIGKDLVKRYDGQNADHYIKIKMNLTKLQTKKDLKTSC